MESRSRTFICLHTRRQQSPFLPEFDLYLADDVMGIWTAIAKELGDGGAPPPFWAFAWPGGLALARYILAHPGVVNGKRVLDFATGSGLCALAAARAGASHVRAVDIDPYAATAVTLNAEANGLVVEAQIADPLTRPPRGFDVVLAGDIAYEEPMSARVLRWLGRAAAGGVTVLVGDPGRAHFPREGPVELARYEVPTSPGLEEREITSTGVYRLTGEIAGDVSTVPGTPRG